MFAGDQDRDRATAALREHFAGGRLTLDELSARTDRVLAARSRADLRIALRGLPLQGRSLAQSAVRGAAIVVATGLWLMFTLVLFLVLALVLLIHGATGTELVGVLAIWLVPTYLLSRLWRRPHS